MKQQVKCVKQGISQYSKNLLRSFKLLVTAAIYLFAPFTWSQEENQIEVNPTVKDMISMIKRDVDSNFVYDYKNTKFVPPEGQTLLIMGQTLERINEYMKHFPNQPIPGGWSAYWGIPEFTGVTESFKNETGGTQNHQMLIDKFSNTVVQSALWMVGKWDIAKNTSDGDYDTVIKKYAKWAKTTQRPIYLRIGYEFDGIHNELEPATYVKAYRRIVDLLRAKGAGNIAFVWHSYASKPYNGYKISQWYPGDDYVDWVGISVFGHGYKDNGFGPDCDAVLEFAKQNKKPVMIAESNPIFGIEGDNVDVWKKWFVNFFSFSYNKNIKAISFINEDWVSLKINGISDWKDGRLYNNEKISKAWFAETNKVHYLKQSPELFELLGYRE